MSEGSAEEFKHGSRIIAQRFLQTAVVVDDEAYTPSSENEGDASKHPVVVPDRHTSTSRQVEQNPVEPWNLHALDAGLLVGSFSELGVICGVIGPADASLETMRKADIVILDWRLQQDDPERALKLLRELLDEEDDKNSLRLVAIYTGEANLEDILKKVFATLDDSGLKPEKIAPRMEISYLHGRVVLYAKYGVNLTPPLKDRSVSEEKLPSRLVNDFASMTEGLLPGITLASLAAVRESAHIVLDRFSAELDPSFLAHRACLSHPDDAERQMVNHIAEELRGLMDNVVANESPASTRRVAGWLRGRDNGVGTFQFKDKNVRLKDVIALANKGVEESDVLTNKQRDNAFRHLSTCFAGKNVTDLDQKLAWIMSFQTVYNAPPPVLWLGSVVTTPKINCGRPLICMRPRCDSVRLKEETVFFFLPLVDPKKGMEQIVVRVDDEFERLGIKLDPDSWVLCKFKPSEGKDTITTDEAFEFRDTCGKPYKWRGELKAEYAQRVAQNFGTMLSRVAIDESEWLRRIARK